MNAVLSFETEKFVNLFYEPNITPYEFLKCFFAKLYSSGERDISRDLDVFLYSMKQKDEYKELLKDIEFRSNGIHTYSNEIEDGIFNLQNVGLLGKKNPSFGKIILQYEDVNIDNLISNIDKEQITLIEKIVEEFKKHS